MWGLGFHAAFATLSARSVSAPIAQTEACELTRQRRLRSSRSACSCSRAPSSGDAAASTRGLPTR